jgi:hypothetical protein
MPIVYEVPTHLNVSDTIVFGLGAHQLVRIAAGGSLGYLVWDQAPALAPEVQAVVACLLIAAAAACALLQPGDRPLDHWVLAGLLYLASPRRYAWRRALATARVAMRDRSDWANSSPELDWAARPIPDGSTGHRSGA